MDNKTGQPNGTLILVLGILGIVCLPILAPIAWVMGNNGMALLNSGQGDEAQRSNVNAGRICGIVGTVLLILGVIWGVLNIGVILAMIAADGGKGLK
ncbi:MAG: hypothetical protein QM758_03535 [Armatimonas sp.]